MPPDPLTSNLAFACTLFPSIAHVCRRIGINRQQFNKYLSGTVRPSRHNMRRICDFFGVTEAELLMEPARFAELISLRRRPGSEQEVTPLGPTLKRLSQFSTPLHRYVGGYFRYFHSYSNPGMIMRSYAQITRRDGHYLWKNIEREDTAQGGPRDVFKYEGMVFYLGERINVVENEALLSSSITQMILYPSYNAGIDYLLGIQTGGPLKRGRKPSASRVVLDYLGQNVDARRAMAQCGLFAPEELDPKIVQLVRNEMPTGAWTFEVEQL
ncbi:helix-turn-helix domain-containing protein [Chachezhania antarctica]|uniref:helix-turn-helix domain-containing protein n=1 Tax=Chachezhania antarctica TaxID=2340860 RepID=UPI000EB3DC41|nr:helix-turn-helix transcriptional regulator [Chachezhania antarctica]|tara:strand:+ start:12264 stop:13070 length:807 start_codon:yes stop_codon:yes gene_type:complete